MAAFEAVFKDRAAIADEQQGRRVGEHPVVAHCLQTPQEFVIGVALRILE